MTAEPFINKAVPAHLRGSFERAAKPTSQSVSIGLFIQVLRAAADQIEKGEVDVISFAATASGEKQKYEFELSGRKP